LDCHLKESTETEDVQEFGAEEEICDEDQVTG
jgi:hypothetical protein